LFTSQYCMHVLVVCADHNFFDVLVLDVLYVGSCNNLCHQNTN
jgi:hypothetical protein